MSAGVHRERPGRPLPKPPSPTSGEQLRTIEIGGAVVRLYCYKEQLAELTPWTPDAIGTMMSRGHFKEGVHYFKPHGSGSRPIFKVSAVIDYIEGRAKPQSENADAIRLADGTMIDLDQATKQAARLLR